MADDHDAPFTLETLLDQGRNGGVERGVLDVVEPPLRRIGHAPG